MTLQIFIIFISILFYSNFAHKFIENEVCEVKGSFGKIEKCLLENDLIFFHGTTTKPIIKVEVS